MARWAHPPSVLLVRLSRRASRSRLAARDRWGQSRSHVCPGAVLALEQLSATRGGPVRRHTSKGERGVLRALVSKHGEDLEAMARDRRLNVDQRTAGELGRAIRKAGGFGAVVGTAG